MVVGGGMALTEAARSCVMDLFPAPIVLTQKCDLLFSDLSFVKAAFVSFFMQIVQQ